MIAIDYTRACGEPASDLFCDKCMSDRAMVCAVYDGDTRRPALAADARDDEDRSRGVISCDGCGAEEEVSL